ncbi:hypothetical protein EAI_10675 [Harpegnathos saltator]|uniref:Uncharacterized protein n=1 Tax=Harpegnathos saltator TaxID=610380 RepID=E2BG31_HARSA|nr:hypothetical protein EAI_10675 [Harpegnathos saltator]
MDSKFIKTKPNESSDSESSDSRSLMDGRSSPFLDQPSTLVGDFLKRRTKKKRKIATTPPSTPTPTIIGRKDLDIPVLDDTMEDLRETPPPMVADSSSYSQEEELAQVGTPRHSAEAPAEAPAEEATTAETSPGEPETAEPSVGDQWEVEVGSPEEACKV